MTATQASVRTTLDALAREAAADPEVPGVLAQVFAPRLDLLWQAAHRGPRAATGSTLQADAPFRIASVTKLHVGAAVLRLVEQDRLRLATPVARWIGSETARLLQGGGHDAARITVAHLLTHTSGLPDHAATDEYARAIQDAPQRRWTRAEQIALAMSMPAAAPCPGSVCAYSDTGYVVLGEVIENVTGRGLGAAVRGLLDYERLGLRQTWWEDDEAAPAGASARATQWLGAVDATGFDGSFDRFGGGGLVSTVADLVTFTRALYRGEVFAQAATLAAALMPAPGARATGTRPHGHVGMLLPAGPAGGWGHLGYWGCGVVHVPDLDVTVAATVNQPFPREAALRTDFVSRLGAAVVLASIDRAGQA